MSTDQQAVPTGGYGYASDEQKVNPFNFGLNTNTFMTKFEWIPNGGKDGAEQEAIDIVFNINGTEKSYRMFPVTQGFDKNNNPVTDPTAPEFKEAQTTFNALITHILAVFVERDTIKTAFARPFPDFKAFVNTAASLLPKNFATITLDIFLQYSFNIRQGADKTYLEIPKKMSYGYWLTKAQPGNWQEVKIPNPSSTFKEALYYVNLDGAKNEEGKPYEKHLFTKNGWFMTSNFAHQQKNSGGGDSDTGSTSAAAASAIHEQGAAKASSW